MSKRIKKKLDNLLRKSREKNLHFCSCSSSASSSSSRYQKRTKLNDFDRFKLRYAKRQRNKMLTIAFNALKKRTKRDGTERKIRERVVKSSGSTSATAPKKKKTTTKAAAPKTAA